MAEIGVDVGKAADILNSGDLVAIPTETVYGLAANALLPNSVVRIFEAKKRPFFDPLIVHISSIHEVEKYASHFPKAAIDLCNKFWPGPLTVILPKKDLVPDLVTAGQKTVALRVPQHPLTLELLKRLEFPLAAPSANPFGYVSPTLASHVQAQLGNKIAYILDGGPSKVGLESTIVSFADGTPKILRLGGLSVLDIEAETGHLDQDIIQNSNPIAPGQLDKHYAPHCSFEIREPTADEFQKKSIALLRFQSYHAHFPKDQQLILSETGSLAEAARHLFDMMRRLDDLKFQLVLAEKVPNEGLGLAINDRLKRASR